MLERYHAQKFLLTELESAGFVGSYDSNTLYNYLHEEGQFFHQTKPVWHKTPIACARCPSFRLAERRARLS